MSDRPIEQIIKRNGTPVDYDRSRIETAIFSALNSQGRPERDTADAMALKVEEALVQTYGTESCPTVEDIQDIVEQVLMHNGLTDIARKYIIYRHQRAMERASRAYQFQVSDHVPYKKIYEVLRWNMEHGCDSVKGLNRIIVEGNLPDLIQASERQYGDEARAAAAGILEKIDNVRIAIVAGPSSSGKTTTMIKVSEHLKKAGIAFKGINIDHYFFNLEEHPKDEFGDYDYETPQALDLELINQHLVQLLKGEEIRTPDYNFKTGQRTLDVHPMTLAENEILLIDSLHGLYEGMTHSIPAEQKFQVYIETLGQFRAADGTMMRWADNRLLRRMIRDKNYRNLQPVGTLTHWHYVRRSELQHIIPFIGKVDCIVNSALPYELPFLKHHLFKYVAEGAKAFEDNPKRLDAHIRANRVYDLLEPLTAVEDDSPIPGHSLLREFIGGSAYTY